MARLPHLQDVAQVRTGLALMWHVLGTLAMGLWAAVIGATVFVVAVKMLEQLKYVV